MAELANDRHLTWYAAREPLVILVLAVIAIAFFSGVAVISRFYNAAQGARAIEWSDRGSAQLKAGHAQEAVTDFYVALSYSRDNYDYQLSLAQALLALHRTNEAFQYLVGLWQREPENGTVNLELARIYAGKQDVTQALRYYHNAIYAIWNKDDEDVQRRAVRLELTNFLLSRGAHGQAESELIALVGNLPNDPDLMAHVGDLFMQVPDYERALAEYRQSLRLKRKNPAALAGAGRAAFELGRYREAQDYLKAAVAANPGDQRSEQLLDEAQLVLEMNPYRMRLSAASRTRVVMNAFDAAGARLKSCLASATPTHPTDPALQALNTEWSQMQLRLRRQARNQDLADSAMDLVFRIEHQASTTCGAPQGKDLALLLIAKSREGD
jgi:tetratricopeptide (TPR) repeat protein